jgi:hypothetical protein
MLAVYIRRDCVLVKDSVSIDILQKSGIGARQLHPIIIGESATTTADNSVSPLLLLDEEVSQMKG